VVHPSNMEVRWSIHVMVNGGEVVRPFTEVHKGEMVHSLAPEVEVKHMLNMKMM
jgi:hypothetical protein